MWWVTSPSADPDPDRTPGLEPGGGVPPGETPPAEASTTSGASGHQPSLPSERSNKVVYGVVVGVVALTVLMLLAYAAGVWG